MASLQMFYQPGALMHLLILCLFLETPYGQENWNNPLSLDMIVSPMKGKNEFTVTLQVKNNVGQCMVVKVSTVMNPSIKYLSAHAIYTSCLCSANKYFWDIQVSDNTALQGKAEVVPAKSICPDDEKIFPVTSYVETATQKIIVS
ncbi:seminal vesicle antigen-like 2 precursor [Mus musculus]|uniref:Prolactin-induced protein n=2 Tax=Mus musculus TaxID=10090 RepID=Q99N75_MOUSE|nr:seminal vesicle antigen-like 2 precursor [Mus musculus]AAI19344.1 Seminal vesicle antigen-like 2 [Mus musculus]AAI19346.1 Seminal vesicle antigen-like 2 [Mus musculus]EDL13496.1 seminal vesicle antigen-like 2, isoform CRA_b [Mus musculus]BAB39397.1 SVA-like protein [Mus musculus]BAB44145.1 SLP-M [Mus musculus]|eukprot:NP_115931.1 seminal vesicle antigen-like 2 precursor [Mus musculus]